MFTTTQATPREQDSVKGQLSYIQETLERLGGDGATIETIKAILKGLAGQARAGLHGYNLDAGVETERWGRRQGWAKEEWVMKHAVQFGLDSDLAAVQLRGKKISLTDRLRGSHP